MQVIVCLAKTCISNCYTDEVACIVLFHLVDAICSYLQQIAHLDTHDFTVYNGNKSIRTTY